MSSWSAALSLLLNLLVGTTLAAMVAAWVWLVVQFRQGKLNLGKPVIRTVPWGFATVCAAMLSWFGLIAIVGLAYARITRRPHGVAFGFTEQMFVITVVNGLALLLIPLLARVMSGATAATLGIDVAGAGKSLRVGALAFLIVTWPVNLLHALCVALVRSHQKHPLEEMVRGGLDWRIAYLAFVSAAILAPAVEELLFRGLLQSWLEGLFRRRAERALAEPLLDEADDNALCAASPRADLWTSWMPIVITSAIFAAAHGAQWPAPIPIFVLSLVLGSVYQRTGNLLASFTVHALFNGFSTLLLFWALQHGAGSEAKSIPPPQSTARLCPATPALSPDDVAQSNRGDPLHSYFFRLAHPCAIGIFRAAPSSVGLDASGPDLRRLPREPRGANFRTIG